MQKRIRELSLRGQGRLDQLKPDDEEKIKSHMDGEFDLNGGVLTIPDCQSTPFPGADIDLNGTYRTMAARWTSPESRRCRPRFEDGRWMERLAAQAGRSLLQERWRREPKCPSISPAPARSPHFGVRLGARIRRAPITRSDPATPADRLCAAVKTLRAQARRNPAFIAVSVQFSAYFTYSIAEDPMDLVILILLGVLAIIVLTLILGSFFTVNTAQVAVITRFGKFLRVAEAGSELEGALSSTPLPAW